MKRLILTIALLWPTMLYAQSQNQRITGTLGALNQQVCLNEVNGTGSITVQFEGTWDGTIQFFVANTSTFWDVSVEKVLTDGSQYVSTSAIGGTNDNGIYRFNATGLRKFCVKMSIYNSGAATATIEAGPGSTFLTKRLFADLFQLGQPVGGGNPLWIQGDIFLTTQSFGRVDAANADPVGTEPGLIVRNIPSGTQAVSGPLTDAQLRATPVPVSGTVSTGGLTDTQLRASAVPVTANAGANLNTSALALESGGNLAAIKAKTDNIPAQGQALAAASTPVVLPAAQITTLTPPAAITGFALEAGHLATIDTSTARIPPQGQAVAGSSMPVVLPAAQITTLTPPAAITGFALNTTFTSGTLSAGTLAATTTAAALAASTAIVEVLVQNDPASAVNVLCGSAGSQTIVLKPGDGLSLHVNNLNVVFCKSASATATVNYLGR